MASDPTRLRNVSTLFTYRIINARSCTVCRQGLGSYFLRFTQFKKKNICLQIFILEGIELVRVYTCVRERVCVWWGELVCLQLWHVFVWVEIHATVCVNVCPCFKYISNMAIIQPCSKCICEQNDLSQPIPVSPENQRVRFLV